MFLLLWRPWFLLVRDCGAAWSRPGSPGLGLVGSGGRGGPV